MASLGVHRFFPFFQGTNDSINELCVTTFELAVGRRLDDLGAIVEHDIEFALGKLP